MAKTGLSIRVGANITEFQKKMDNVTQKMGRMGKKMQSIGRDMSMYVTGPLAALGGAAVLAFDKQIQAESKLAAAVRATGGDVETTLAGFKEYASGLQDITTVGDESTLQLLQVATNMGLTADQSKMAAKEAIALSKAMGINEQSAIRYTAALAQGDATMLRRYLPTLRSIENEAEMTAKAHELLAGMFQTAVAEAESGLGPMRQLQNQFGDLLEEIGAIISRGIMPLVKSLKDGVTWLQGLSDKTKLNVTVFAGFVAAAGPVLAVMGLMVTQIAALISIMGRWTLVVRAGIALQKAYRIAVIATTGGLTGLVRALKLVRAAMLANPWTAAATAIVAAAGALFLFKDRTEEVTEKTDELNDKISTERAELEGLFAIVKKAKDGTNLRREAINKINEKYGKYLDNLITEKSNLSDIEAAQKQATNALIHHIAVQRQQVEIQQLQEQKMNEIIAIQDNLAESTGKSSSLIRAALSDLQAEYDKIDKTKVGDPLQEMLIQGADNIDFFRGKAEALGINTSDLANAFLAYNNALGLTDIAVDGVIGKYEQFISQTVKAQEETNRLTGATREYSGELQKLPSRLGIAAEASKQTTDEALVPQAQAIKNLHSHMVDLDESILLTAETSQKAGEEMTEAIRMAAQQSGASVASFANNVINSAKKVLSALLATAVAKAVEGAAWLGPLAPLAAVAAGAAMKIAFNSIVPQLATGGLAFGPTMAMVGDNPGAGVDPEVIAPLSKLSGMMGAQDVRVTGQFRVSGNDLILAINQTERSNQRATGKKRLN